MAAAKRLTSFAGPHRVQLREIKTSNRGFGIAECLCHRLADFFPPADNGPRGF
jgi:hypothetical protein